MTTLSEEQNKPAATNVQASDGVSPSDAWGDDISLERQVELEQRLQAWEQEADHGEREGPFDGGMDEEGIRRGVALTGADLFWLAARTLAGTHEAWAIGKQMERLQQARDDVVLQLDLSLDGLHLERAGLEETHLEGAFLSGAHLEAAGLSEAHLDRANLSFTHLEGARLYKADLRHADLSWAHLEYADLYEAQLEGADLGAAGLAGADLRRAFLDGTTDLTSATLGYQRRGGVQLADVHWGGVNMAVVNWRKVRRLGDDQQAGENHDAAENRAGEYEDAARAYRSLSLVLRAQGLTADASRFHYRAEVMGRCSLFHRTRALFMRQWVRYTPLLLVSPLLFVPWLLSWLFGAVAGYGVYHIWRLFLTYLGLVSAFAVVFFVFGQHTLTLPTALDSLALSVSAFHGRGVQPANGVREDMLWLAGLESVVGLIVEALFIAALTRRVTGS